MSALPEKSDPTDPEGKPSRDDLPGAPKPTAPFNPCSCWSLKDGCIVVGIWTIICASLQIALFGWQTSVVRMERTRSSNSRAVYFGTLQNYDRRYPAYYEQYYQTPEERFYLQLFIIQIIHLITDMFLLGSGIAIIWGIQKRVKLVMWPYFVTVILNIIANIAFCGVWFSSPAAPSSASKLSTSFSVRDRIPYWLVLAIVAILFSVINIYAFVVIISGYQHLQRGRLKNSRGYFLEPRPPMSQSGTPKTSMVSLAQPELGKSMEKSPMGTMGLQTKVMPQDFVNPMLQTAGSIRKPMDPSLFATMPQHNFGYPYPTGYGYPNPGTVNMGYPNPTGVIPQQPDMTPVPPYRPGGTPGGYPAPAAEGVKQQFTELWLNNVQPGTGLDPAPIFVGPPTQSVLGGSQRGSHRRRSGRRHHGSRSSLRSRSSNRSRSRRSRTRGSETDTSTSETDDETRSRTSRRTCDSCRRRVKYDDEKGEYRHHRRRHRSGHGHDTPTSGSDTGYSEFTRSRTGEKHRYSGSDTETFATSYLDNASRSSARRSTRQKRSQSDDERRRSKRRDRDRTPTRQDGRKEPPSPAPKPKKPLDPLPGDGYTSAPTGINEAGNRGPITGAAGGGARIIMTPSKAAGAGSVSGSSFSENPTLPMTRKSPQQTGGAGGMGVSPGQGAATTPTKLTANTREYQVNSDFRIQYHPQPPPTGASIRAPASGPPNPAPHNNRPHGGVALPGLTSTTPGGAPPPQMRPTTTDQTNTSSGSNATRTYGTTAV